MSGLKIAICGGGIGGLSAAIALNNCGHQITVFERTKSFNRVGADINLTRRMRSLRWIALASGMF